MIKYCHWPGRLLISPIVARVMELVDMTVSKTVVRKDMRVRIPPLAPIMKLSGLARFAGRPEGVSLIRRRIIYFSK